MRSLGSAAARQQAEAAAATAAPLTGGLLGARQLLEEGPSPDASRGDDAAGLAQLVQGQASVLRACTPEALGLPLVGAALSAEQQEALLAVCRAVARLPPAEVARLEAAMQAAAAPFVEALSQTALPLVFQALGEGAGFERPPGH